MPAREEDHAHLGLVANLARLPGPQSRVFADDSLGAFKVRAGRFGWTWSDRQEFIITFTQHQKVNAGYSRLFMYIMIRKNFNRRSSHGHHGSKPDPLDLESDALPVEPPH